MAPFLLVFTSVFQLEPNLEACWSNLKSLQNKAMWTERKQEHDIILRLLLLYYLLFLLSAKTATRSLGKIC